MWRGAGAVSRALFGGGSCCPGLRALPPAPRPPPPDLCHACAYWLDAPRRCLVNWSRAPGYVHGCRAVCESSHPFWRRARPCLHGTALGDMDVSGLPTEGLHVRLLGAGENPGGEEDGRRRPRAAQEAASPGEPIVPRMRIPRLCPPPPGLIVFLGNPSSLSLVLELGPPGK